ncbi:Hemerythrin HHE cation binding domain-containing protein [Pseudomonas flavescens]|uniref:Hemerythrin HHE cation binding domain-containing protein n=1 Tax=Phytopseudomonas flavescens TaxID=29435 RepID=A0A1G8EZ10_9GAMM|nr:hemerythrin domain-containing protein [Pseudomonas flavescens]SDH75145.1 Hemerythrin HHE cation binding domain-containing protein [Pseudomonas flavescens]
MQIFEALRESHDRQRSMAEALVATHGDSPERARYYRELKEELLAHARAEERFFYSPLMKHDSGVDLSRHGVAEHHEMDELLETLEDTDPSSPAWIANARKLKEKIFHHLEDEEHSFFQQAGKMLTPQQKTSLASQYVKDYQDALG